VIEEKWEATKSRARSAKEHVSRNKAAYITGGVCLVIGAVGGAAAVRQVSVSPKLQNVALLNWKPLNVLFQTIVVELPARGHRGLAIVDTTSKKVYASLNETAAALGVSPTTVRNHLNGLKDDIDGHILQVLGENLSEQVTVGV
jgi:hypothetical protein